MGTGGGASCTVLSTWNETVSVGGYDMTNQVSYLDKTEPGTGTVKSYLSQEIYYGAVTTVVPAVYTVTAADTYQGCAYCVTMNRDCTDPMDYSTCAGGRYFARAGTYAITTATQDANTGSFVSQLTNMTFVEWNFLSTVDAPVPNGRCFTLTSEASSVNWP